MTIPRRFVFAVIYCAVCSPLWYAAIEHYTTPAQAHVTYNSRLLSPTQIGPYTKFSRMP